VSNQQYFLPAVPNLNQTNEATSTNTNHRLNMRLEWRIDSSNQLIITPNVSIQNNQSDRQLTTFTTFPDGRPVGFNNNETTSDRNGINLNSNILYRHSFRKRGRTFSVNLNTSSNDRTGDVYVNTLQRKFNGINTPTDSIINRFTDQTSSGYSLSANFIYTEPITQKSQLQVNYNPSYNNSKSDQQAFRQSQGDGRYTLFDTSLSNRFDNINRAQSAGLTYRYGDRDNMLAIGANYQQNTLESDQQFPSTFG
jgi:hypothetical protein